MSNSDLTLTRSDPARNMHRYYRLDVQPDLFGMWCFVREWGRIAAPDRCGKSPTLPRMKRGPRSTGSAAGRSAGGMREPHGMFYLGRKDGETDGSVAKSVFCSGAGMIDPRVCRV